MLRREGTHSDDALQQFSETREDRRACSGLHTSEVAAGVQISDPKDIVDIADNDSGNNEGWEDCNNNDH